MMPRPCDDLPRGIFFAGKCRRSGDVSLSLHDWILGKRNQCIQFPWLHKHSENRGEAITKVEQFIQLIGETKGEAIPVEIQRGSGTLKLTAKPGRLGLALENKPHTEAK